MSQEDTMRLVAELLDKTSGPLKDIQKSLKATQDIAKGLHTSGAGHAREHAKAFHELRESIAKIKETAIEVVSPSMAALGLTAFSVAGAIEAVKEAVKGLGEAGEKLTYASRQSGATVGMLRSLGEAGQRFGVTQESMNAGLAKFGAFMDQNARRAPDALNAWNQMPGAWQRIGKSLIGLNRDAQVNKVLDFIPSMKYMDQKRKLLAMMGLPEDWANLTHEESVKIREAGERFNRDHPLNLHNAEKAKEAWDNVGTSLRGIRDDLGAAFSTEVTEAMESIHRFFDDKATISFIRGEFERIAQGIRDTAREINTIIGAVHSFNEWRLHGPSGKGHYPQGEDPMGKDYTATTPPLNRLWNNLTGNNSGKAELKDAVTEGFLDALRQQNSTGGYSPMAYHPGGGSGPGDASFGSSAYPALNDDGSSRGGGASGGDGGGGGGGGSRGNRNNNRGNMKMGPLAQAFGATSSDGKGFAIFPDQISGDAAQHALINSKKYQGLTLDQFGNKYSKGSADWKRTVGKQMGIGLNDIVKTNDPRLQGAIRKAEGTDGGMLGGSRNSGGDGKEVPKSVLAGAENLLRAGGNSQQLQQFMAMNGYPKSGNWCGQFAGAVVRAAGGTPPKNAAIASNWMGYGQHVDAADAKPGDIAVRTRSRFGGLVKQGQTGGHVGLVHDVDADHGRFNLTGGNQGRAVVGHGTHEYEFRRAVEKHGANIRDHIRGNRKSQTDGMLLENGKRSDNGGLNGSASLTIDLNGFPRGIKTAQSHEGLFKEVTLNRGRPMSSASETA